MNKEGRLYSRPFSIIRVGFLLKALHQQLSVKAFCHFLVSHPPMSTGIPGMLLVVLAPLMFVIEREEFFIF